MEIEKGIPMPPAAKGPRSELALLADEMKPGDSVMLETESQANSLTHLGRRRGYKMALRKMKGGFRVWRSA